MALASPADYVNNASVGCSIGRKHIEAGMDDATLVTLVASRYLQERGSEAIGYLREMQELAASLSDGDSAKAWGDIETAVRTILLALRGAPARRGDSAPTRPFPVFAN